MKGCFAFFLLCLGPPGWFILFLWMLQPPPLDTKSKPLDPLNKFANTFYGKRD